MRVALTIAHQSNHVGQILVRRGVAMLAVMALLVQLLSPALARASGAEWIEICSDLGAVWVQIDPETDGDAAQSPDRDKDPCPKCQHCLLCQTALPSGIESAAITLMARLEATGSSRPGSQVVSLPRRHLRPVTRGPPPANPFHSVRVPNVSRAFLFEEGGALSWT